MSTVPTSITDKNGKQTTVHKNVDKAVDGNASRVAAVAPVAPVNPVIFTEASAAEYVSELIDVVREDIAANPRRSYGELSVSDDAFFSEAVWFYSMADWSVDNGVLRDAIDARLSGLESDVELDEDESGSKAESEVVLWASEFGTGDIKAAADANVAAALAGDIDAGNIVWTAALLHLRDHPEEIAGFNEDEFYIKWRKDTAHLRDWD